MLGKSEDDMGVDIAIDHILQLTASIWENVLQLPVESLDAPLPNGMPTLAACVHISGAWEGSILLACGTPLAATAAAVMFGIHPADASMADMHDALRELVNMLGGNLKALLSGDCHLSVPTVIEGQDYTISVPQTRQVHRLLLRCGEQPLAVTLLETQASPSIVAA